MKNGKEKGLIVVLLASLIAICVVALVSASMPTAVPTPTPPATCNLSVRAENDYNFPGYPTEIDVFADDSYTGTLYFSENDDSWTVESLQIPSGTRTIRLEFANDWCAGFGGDGGDLNAYIDWLEIDGIHIEAESFVRTGKGDIFYHEGDWETDSFDSYDPYTDSYDHYGVEHIFYEPLAEGAIIEMSQSPSWAEYDLPTIITISTDKQAYNIGEIVSMTIEINRLGEYPQQMSLELWLKEPYDNPDMIYKSSTFIMPVVFQWSATVPIRIDNSIWIPGSKYSFKAILRDPKTGDIIAKNRASFIIEIDAPIMDKLKSLEEEIMEAVEAAEL